jgi:hypothetical protein
MTLASSKTSSLQTYTMLLYRNPLHPEFFAIEGRTRIKYGEYDFEAWIFRGGHAVRFNTGGSCIAEVVVDQAGALPGKGQIIALPCAGEKDHEDAVADAIVYMTSIQPETLSDHLYLSTYNELVEHGRACEGAMCLWTDDSGKPNLSLIDTQRYNEEVHLQSYHLRSDCCLVLRTQSIFQVKDKG